MKTINSKKNTQSHEDFRYFIDEETGECSGFAGTVTLYDSKIYVDTRTGIGYKEVIEKLKPLIHKLANRYHFNGNLFEDTRQDIIVHILEGIPKYDPHKDTKLSTFIEMRVNRRLINEIRNRSRISKNATYLKVGVFNVQCDCGHSFIHKLGEFYEIKCHECGRVIDDNTKKMPMTIPEVSESMLRPGGLYENMPDYQDPIIGDEAECIDESVIFMHDMRKWLENEDPRVVKILELIYFQDYSIKAAAEEVGLSGAGANMKLKELANNKLVRELFNR